MRSVKLLVVTGLAAASTLGCGDAATPGGDRAVVGTERAREVAAAWTGSEAARVWRQGYYPLGDAVQLPDKAFHDDNDKHAYITGNFRLEAPLPGTTKPEGEVRWSDGRSLTLPLTTARSAYDELARGGNSGPSLRVTGARLGTMTLLTSRGTATVPAWLFTIKGYDTPLKRVAVTPGKLPRPPIGPVRKQTAALGPLGGFEAVAGNGRTLTVRADHGACDDGPAVDVLETQDSVVLSASIRGVSDGPCTSELRTEKVTVKLRGPFGRRILLDAFTGRPVPYRQPGSASPSWS
ncbi:hypothetical protein [Streptomyces sp. NPDC127038]|uniref:hypothetical protein n=1 Tax=Streptomyces sp. NPDC127038 TaxID=3347114 RepID=UPI003665B719